MVKVELVSDDAPVPDLNQGLDASSDEEELDDFDINESLSERIVALKDVVPPNYRNIIASTFSDAYSLAQSTVKFGGKSLWVLTSSAMLLGVPLSLCTLAEQQLVEMEKGMQLGETNDVLAPGAELQEPAKQQ